MLGFLLNSSYLTENLEDIYFSSPRFLSHSVIFFLPTPHYLVCTLYSTQDHCKSREDWHHARRSSH